jgi:hypothetical protein
VAINTDRGNVRDLAGCIAGANLRIGGGSAAVC